MNQESPCGRSRPRSNPHPGRQPLSPTRRPRVARDAKLWKGWDCAAIPPGYRLIDAETDDPVTKRESC